MIKEILILLFLLCLFNVFSQDAEDKVSEKEDNILTFEEYITILEEKLPDLKQNDNKLALSRVALIKANALHDVLFSFSAQGVGNKTYPDGQPTEIDYSSGFQMEGMFSSTLPSGTRVNLGAGYQQIYSWGKTEMQDYNNIPMTMTGPDFSNIPTYDDEFTSVTYDPYIKIGVVQPLLYNWFGFLDRYGKKDARMKLQIEQLKHIENKNTIMTYYKALFFRWIEYKEILKYLETTIENAKKLEAQTRRKVNAGIAENDEYQRVKYSVYKYQEQYNATEVEYKKILDELAIFIDASLLEPEVNEFDSYFKKSADYEIAFLEFEKTRSSEILGLTKKNIEYNRRVSINKLMPQLNLFGSLDIKFHQFRKDPIGDTTTEMKYESSNGDIDFVAGLEFIYPIGDHKSRGELKEVNLMLNDLNLSYEITKNSYVKNMNIIINNTGMLRNNIDLKEKSIDALKSQYRTERVKYNQARIDLSYLLETENSIKNEEIELIKLKSLFIILFFDYLRLTE